MPKIIENLRDQLLQEARKQIAERGYTGTIVLENGYGSLPLCAQVEDRFSLILQDMETVRKAMAK